MYRVMIFGQFAIIIKVIQNELCYQKCSTLTLSMNRIISKLLSVLTPMYRVMIFGQFAVIIKDLA